MSDEPPRRAGYSMRPSPTPTSRTAVPRVERDARNALMPSSASAHAASDGHVGCVSRQVDRRRLACGRPLVGSQQSRIRSSVEDHREQVAARDAVDHAVVHLRDHRPTIVVEAFDDPHLPQRSVTVERLAPSPARRAPRARGDRRRAPRCAAGDSRGRSERRRSTTAGRCFPALPAHAGGSGGRVGVCPRRAPAPRRTRGPGPRRSRPTRCACGSPRLRRR